jgi:predicted nucleotidyltransferase
MDKNQILKVLADLRSEVSHRYKAEIKGIFGSVSRGENTSTSDIDIIVKFHDGATFLDCCGLGLYLEEQLGCKIDIVSEDAVRKEIRESIYQDLLPV